MTMMRRIWTSAYRWQRIKLGMGVSQAWLMGIDCPLNLNDLRCVGTLILARNALIQRATNYGRK